MNISMYRTVKSLEITEVEVHRCFILCTYLFMHKTLILCNVVLKEISAIFLLLLYSSLNKLC